MTDQENLEYLNAMQEVADLLAAASAANDRAVAVLERSQLRQHPVDECYPAWWRSLMDVG